MMSLKGLVTALLIPAVYIMTIELSRERGGGGGGGLPRNGNALWFPGDRSGWLVGGILCRRRPIRQVSVQQREGEITSTPSINPDR